MTRTMQASLLTLALAALLAGCASPTRLDEAPVESRTPVAVDGVAGAAGATAGGATPGTTAATPQSSVATVDLARSQAAAADAAIAAAGRIVYFDFDSFEVKDEFRTLVEAHARALVAQRNRRLSVEGHADERGGREYNLALGQKRAEAVARSLMLLGANEGQVEAVSFGEERPAVEGSDEAAWARNRRAELKDR